MEGKMQLGTADANMGTIHIYSVKGTDGMACQNQPKLLLKVEIIIKKHSRYFEGI